VKTIAEPYRFYNISNPLLCQALLCAFKLGGIMDKDSFVQYSPYRVTNDKVNSYLQKLYQIRSQIDPDDPLLQECDQTINYARTIQNDVIEKANLFPVQILIAVVILIVIFIFGSR
jgi:hypothetical protein